jgi:hypothetical protein
MEGANSLQPPWQLRLLFRKTQRAQTARLGFGIEKENPTSIQENRHHGRGLAHISAYVGTMLAEMGEHQLMIRDYLRHANLHVTNKYLQATTNSKRLAQGKLVEATLPNGLLSASRSSLVH